MAPDGTHIGLDDGVKVACAARFCGNGFATGIKGKGIGGFLGHAGDGRIALLPFAWGGCLLAQLDDEDDDDDLKLQLHSSQCTPGSRGVEPAS